jgi:hypothetical protein
MTQIRFTVIEDLARLVVIKLSNWPVRGWRPPPPRGEESPFQTVHFQVGYAQDALFAGGDVNSLPLYGRGFNQGFTPLDVSERGAILWKLLKHFAETF